MPRASAPIDVDSLPELARLVEEVERTRQPHVLRRDGREVAVLLPAPGRSRSRTPRTAEEALAIVERTAGVFKQYAIEPPPTPREEKAAFEQAVVEQVMESMGR
jgi:hypothetical protein